MQGSYYTLVQHSGYGYNADLRFVYAVEERALQRAAEVAQVTRVGGLLFNDYGAAVERVEQENYPDPAHTGLLPKVRGTFSLKLVDGLRIYVPAPDDQKGSSA
jgi:hypothetical protein